MPGIPKYQQVAELPALQLELASTTSTLPREGPASLTQTLCSFPFLQLKIEAGLLEDLLRDFRAAYRLLRAKSLSGQDEFLAGLNLHVNNIVSFLKILVKPFHACTLQQLAQERITLTRRGVESAAEKGLKGSTNSSIGDGAHGEAARDPRSVAQVDASSADDFPPTTFLAVENPYSNPLVMSSAVLPTDEAVRCCDVMSSSSASPCIALGLDDGHVVLWYASSMSASRIFLHILGPLN